jgi:hypothetical protein
MAEKKAKPKAKAKPEPKPEPETKASKSSVYDQIVNIKISSNSKPVMPASIEFGPAVVPMSLIHSASDLAAMARDAKAGKGDMDDVIAEHDIYLSLVKMGASAPAADIDFVKKHMAHLKTL